jgi:cation:H+ antiporter
MPNEYLWIIHLLAIIVGLGLLVWSADRFVLGGSATAHNLGVPTLIIGMMIMGFGTSAPEIFVAIIAALQDNPSVALGNAIGSNIANIGLVVGIAAVIAPLSVSSKILKREYPILFAITALVFVLIVDLDLTRWDGAILLCAMGALLGWMLWLSKNSGGPDPLISEFESELPPDMSTAKALAWTGFALVILIASSHALVWGAVELAHKFGVSDLVIGLTIIAVGTSLPEVAVSVSAALKKEHDIVIGNVIGSNMFNSLAVIGIAAAIDGSTLQSVVLSRDFAMMLGLTVTLFIMAYGFRNTRSINRYEGSLLLLAYAGYMVWLYFTDIHA